MLLSLFSQLVIKVFVGLHLVLLFHDQLFDVRVLVSLQLGDKSLLVGFFLGLELLLQLLICFIISFLGIVQLFFLLEQVLSRVLEFLDLDRQVL